MLFTDTICKENPDCIIKIGHGEIVSVRVPTAPDGNYLFWEFATDSYDIGFGLFFEWTKNPGNQVSVHISESEDEEEEADDDDEDGPTTLDEAERAVVGTGVVANLGESAVEQLKKEGDEIPSSVIIPIYRVDSHESVCTGSHRYPGSGLYVLKFDNSYSLWRSKTLYYRVYYTK